MPVNDQLSAINPEPQEHEPVIAPRVAVLTNAVEALAVTSRVPAAVHPRHPLGLEGVTKELGGLCESRIIKGALDTVVSSDPFMKRNTS